jgi:tetratricopeptide (TPR) repeat protein
VQVLLGLGVLGAAAGVWMLLHPAAFWLAPWRPEAQAVGSRFIFGPYPIEKDFQALKAQGVTTIVSLLDSDLPYEMVLLGQEKALAEKYGMKVLNFPMASILGQSWGKDYVANSEAAAAAAIEADGIVYVHCYLGLHRAANVRKILETHARTATYGGSVGSERSPDRLALDRASNANREQRFEDALREIAGMQVKTLDAQLLEGWVNYRMGRIEPARAIFGQVLAENPGQLDAMEGLGYAALRVNDLQQAEPLFTELLAKRPGYTPALEGLGHVRYRQGRAAEARQLFEQVLQKSPDNVEVREIVEKLRLSARRAVIVVVDGLRPDAVADAPAPQMRQLMAAGAATSAARVVGIAETLPSIATIVSGRSPSQHGLVEVGGQGNLAGPTLFSQVRAAGGRAALYFGKRQLALLAPAGAVHTRHGPAPNDPGGLSGSSAELVAQFARDARAQPFDLVLIHLREPDLAGHRHGFASGQYLEAVRQADQAVGGIRQVVAGMPGRTTLFLTADHAGDGRRHGGDSAQSWIVPFGCQGPAIARGAIQGSVTLLDVAPTVLAVLGLPPLPGAEGKPVGACVAA